MKKYIVFSLIFLASTMGYAQNSDKAKKYLDEVSSKVNSYNNISISFKYALNNEAENISQTTKGDVVLVGQKYKLNMLGVTRIYDGKKLYNISPEDEEVTITNADEEDEGTITPSKMLTFYQEGYRYEWDKKLPIKGRQIQYVKLIPIDSNSDTKFVLLGIDANTKNIYNLIETLNNGSVTTFTVNSFKTNQPLSESLFTFDKSKYSDYYINE